MPNHPPQQRGYAGGTFAEPAPLLPFNRIREG